jgi:prepilin-type N-terminal cleavage/methylation domain-containing protein
MRRRGFTLAEVVVATIVLAIVAGVAVASFAGYNNQKRVAETAEILASLGTSLNNNNTAGGGMGFLQTVSRKYPRQLNHLTRQILRTDLSCIAAVYVTADTVAWRTWAPYSGLNIIQGQGVATPIGWVHDSVVKGTAGAGTAGWVELHIDSISPDDAQSLDILVDNSSNAAAGLVRYVPTTGVPTLRLVRYLIPSPVTAGVAQIGC